MQVFMLHFAGGNCYSYDFLKRLLPVGFQGIPLELPGRGRRISEGLLYSRADAIADYSRQIAALRDPGCSYIIYGHSMGASLGLYLARDFEQQNDPPAALVVTGNAGPGISDEEPGSPQRYLLGYEEFKDELRRLGGISEELLASKELYDFFEPIIRADFQIVDEEKDPDDELTVHVPVIAVMGSDEKNADQIDNWKNYARGYFSGKTLPGNHFFIYDYAQELKNTIVNSRKLLLHGF